MKLECSKKLIVCSSTPQNQTVGKDVWKSGHNTPSSAPQLGRIRLRTSIQTFLRLIRCKKNRCLRDSCCINQTSDHPPPPKHFKVSGELLHTATLNAFSMDVALPHLQRWVEKCWKVWVGNRTSFFRGPTAAPPCRAVMLRGSHLTRQRSFTF